MKKMTTSNDLLDDALSSSQIPIIADIDIDRPIDIQNEFFKMDLPNILDATDVNFRPRVFKMIIQGDEIIQDLDGK